MNHVPVCPFARTATEVKYNKENNHDSNMYNAKSSIILSVF